jgi:hypothetical protein
MYDGYLNSLYNPGILSFSALMSTDRNSNDYFSSLPEEVQAGINEHQDEIHSVEELHAYAEEFMKKR